MKSDEAPRGGSRLARKSMDLCFREEDVLRARDPLGARLASPLKGFVAGLEHVNHRA